MNHQVSSPTSESQATPDRVPGTEYRDWRLTIPQAHRRPFGIWFYSIAAVTMAVLVVGGITRLTLSGLSIVDWDPLMGVVPPITDAQWQEKFAQYQQYPDYSWRDGMTLEQFRFIYFWEYLHRLLARSIGMVFLVPFAWFAARRRFSRPLLTRSLILFALGAMQGLMGWLMVMSGLVDRPSVSHYRLAAHLSLAFAIFGYALWLARDLRDDSGSTMTQRARTTLMRGLSVVGAILGMQIIWGAFVAGLRAGKYYPTFPLMGGRIVPPGMLRLEPVLRNFSENPIAVQWTHRAIGTALLAAAIVFAVRVARTQVDASSRRYAIVLTTTIAIQYLLGIITLVTLVPVSMGVIHQAFALVVFGVWLSWLNHARGARLITDNGIPDRSAIAPDR